MHTHTPTHIQKFSHTLPPSTEHAEMDLLKGSGKQVDAVIDKAAGVVKEKVGDMIGGGTKEPKKDQGIGEMVTDDVVVSPGIGEMVTDAVKGVAANAAKDSAADKAKSFGKSLLK
ncbi:uncharacterized protein LOC118357445 isoform X2 [Oncorhynchus keta]|uniref:uncharacterized protein LOC118357445 isoform X2 n=1 Tax=Oncorhynchus keta TaxID=8018 RepID=UPI00227BA2BA|nr:uncharacterized protein LOC118357445 isoform X2 [Oncorhynchus keta]